MRGKRKSADTPHSANATYGVMHRITPAAFIAGKNGNTTQTFVFVHRKVPQGRKYE